MKHTTWILLGASIISFGLGVYAHKYKKKLDNKEAHRESAEDRSFPVRLRGPSLEKYENKHKDIVYKKTDIQNVIVEPIAYHRNGVTQFLGTEENDLMQIIRDLGKWHFYWAVAGDVNGDGNDDILLSQRNLYGEAKENGVDPSVNKRLDKAVPTLILSKGDTYEISKSFDALSIQCQEEQIIFADFDNDLDLDIFMPCYTHVGYTRNYLLENDGAGNFKDVSDGSGTEMFNQPHKLRVEGAQAFDYNNDGLLDFYVASRIYQNNGNFKFTAVTQEVGIEKHFDEALKITDYNNDGELDLVVFRPYYGPYFYQRVGDKYMVDNDALKAMSAYDPNQKKYDTNNDGYFDFGYVGLSTVDFNFDGKTDFIAGTYDSRRTKGGKTTPILMNEGEEFGYYFPEWADDMSENHIVRGPSVADIDNDGVLEMARSTILYVEGKKENVFTGQVYDTDSQPQNFIKITFLSPDGKRVMQGRSLLIEGDGFKKRVLVDTHSGFLNSHDYIITQHLPDNVRDIKITYTYNGGNIGIKAKPGDKISIYAGENYRYLSDQ